MKKLIITAFAVAFGFSAQAAVYKWGGQYVADGYNGAGDSSVAAVGATTYLLISGYSLNPAGTEIVAASSYTYDVISMALASDTLSIAMLEAAAIGKTTVTGDEGVFNGQKSDMTGLTNGETYKFYSIIVSTDGKYALEAGSQDIKTNDITGNAQLAMGDLWNKTSAQGNWYATAAVPEPTSGLLILIGMAGLALKRRRS